MATGDGYREIDEITDNTGDSIHVGIFDNRVSLRINHGPVIWLAADERDRFARAWAEAERQAEMHVTAAHP